MSWFKKLFRPDNNWDWLDDLCSDDQEIIVTNVRIYTPCNRCGARVLTGTTCKCM